jgi:hypothetical protein
MASRFLDDLQPFGVGTVLLLSLFITVLVYDLSSPDSNINPFKDETVSV